jgi:excisionase family DNA binding protein
VERRIAHLNRLEGRAMFDMGQGEDAAAYRQERRALWQELQTLKALLSSPQGLQDKAACQAVTITVGLNEMSQHEQRRWRKKLGHLPCTTWLVTFREYLYRHPQMGRNPIYIDVHTTTEDDITVQVLAYLLQAEMVLWEDIEPWVKDYSAAGGQETEGKHWDTYLRRTWCQEMLEFALPHESNALRPVLPAQREPETYSIPQAAKVLGISERQLRYKIEHEEMPGVEKLGRLVRILPEALEHLRQQVMDQARRQQDKTQRAMFSAQAQQVGMKPPAIRQMIHRGPQTPEGGPDWEALEAQLT